LLVAVASQLGGPPHRGRGLTANPGVGTPGVQGHPISPRGTSQEVQGHPISPTEASQGGQGHPISTAGASPGVQGHPISPGEASLGVQGHPISPAAASPRVQGHPISAAGASPGVQGHPISPGGIWNVHKRLRRSTWSLAPIGDAIECPAPIIGVNFDSPANISIGVVTAIPALSCCRCMC
jgi:hypothetical protein